MTAPILTPREQSILALVVEGKSNRQIGGTLFISPHTVDFHLRRIFKKLKVNSRFEVIAAFYKTT